MNLKIKIPLDYSIFKGISQKLKEKDQKMKEEMKNFNKFYRYLKRKKAFTKFINFIENKEEF